MKHTACPSCGAEVQFRSAASVLAVCAYCRSTLLRKDLDVENLGKMAELLEDASPVQLGTEGRYHGRGFSVVGRIQLRYEGGIWNEWHLLFEDGRSGWLGETPGQCAVTFVMPPPDPCPAFDELPVGRVLMIGDHGFQVVNRETLRCIAGEGELPFQVGAGYDSAAVDLQGPGKRFATLDFSETPPLLFLGEYSDFGKLELKNLRDLTQRSAEVKTTAFQCTGCGAPLEPKSAASVVIACGSCGSVLDLTHEQHRILSHADPDNAPRPWIPLGTRGHLRGRDYEVIGFLRRQIEVEGLRYFWDEYLLMDLGGGFAWLSEYQGHWNYILPADHQPAFIRLFGKDRAQYQGRMLFHFQDSQPVVTYVVGEFYWRAKVGEQVRLQDYVDPPYLLSVETSEKEVNYSFAEYLGMDELKASFGKELELPAPVGVFANQPSPWRARLAGEWKRYGLLVLALLVLQVLFSVRGTGRAPLQTAAVTLAAPGPSAAVVTPDFDVTGANNHLEVEANVPIDNGWLGLNVSLVDAEGRNSFDAAQEMSFYQGYEDDEAWTEGSRTAEFSYRQVPPGRYHLVVAGEGDVLANGPVNVVLSVRKSGGGWGNFVLALLALTAWPGFITWRNSAFEARRWMESDHPTVSDD